MTTIRLKPSTACTPTPRSRQPRVDIVETTTEVRLSAELPGVKESDVSITLADRELSLEAHRELTTPEAATALLQELGESKYQRVFRLGETLDTDGVEAEFHNGVLEIRIPKREEIAPRSIAVKTG